MRRSDLLIKIISVIVFIAIALYIGYYAYDAQVSPLKTTLAVSYVGGDFVHTEGYIVRDEKTLSCSGDSYSLAADDGEKISVGQTVAKEYKNTGAADRSDDMATIELRIEQMQNLLKGISAGDKGKEAAYDSVRSLSHAVKSSDLSELKNLLIEIDSCVFTDLSQYTAEDLKQQIAVLENQLDFLKESSASDTVYINATDSGTFTSVIDGYEHISPNDLQDLTPESYKSLFAEQKISDSFGKLCLGTRWYYATIVNTETAGRLSPGGKIELSFSKTYDEKIAMTIESVGPEENGKCVVIFSSNKYMPVVCSLREAYADIVFDSFTGLRVPKEAVHMDEEGQFLYILSGVQAEKVDIKVISQSGDYYIVQSMDTVMLHEGSEIITKANDLHDGKVVQENTVI